MTAAKILLSSVLTLFLALTGLVIYQHGYVGFFELANANSATRLLGVDLVIALGLFLVWMRVDSRERGMAFLPYLLITLTLGSAGPLLYLIRRESRRLAPQASAARA